MTEHNTPKKEKAEYDIPPFLKKINHYILSHKLLNRQAKYIVALSGGADSVALLHILYRLGIDTEAAHCNFHLRGAESDRDEEFCKALCKRMGIPFHLAHFDTASYAHLHHISIEMAARQLRYSYFHQLMNDLHAEAVCVAHHQDDSVETVLLNLVRGTGIHGLRGILPRNGHIIRPLLCVGRKDIEHFLATIHQEFVTDSTNLIDDVKRNKIRLNVIPLLQTLNPNVKNSIALTAHHVMEACNFFDASIQQAIASIKDEEQTFDVFHIEKIKKTASPEYVLFVALKGYGFSSTQIQEIARCVTNNAQGKTWRSQTHELLADRGRLIVEKVPTGESAPRSIPVDGLYAFDDLGMRFNIRTYPIEEIGQIEKDKKHLYLDAERAPYPLKIRRVQKGDRFVPFGMKRDKLLSDYLTNEKKNIFEKRRQLVITTHDDIITWVVNERADNRFRITSSTTIVREIALL